MKHALNKLGQLRSILGYRSATFKAFKAANKPLMQRWERLCAYVGEKEIVKRDNWINRTDYERALKAMRKGDIILTGLYRTVGWAAVIRDIVNHAMYYAGNGKVIHATTRGGVKEQGFDWLCSYYDGFIVLRMKSYEENKKLIPAIDRYIRRRIGMDYNYHFNDSRNRFLCTHLINRAFINAGYNTKLGMRGRFSTYRRRVPFVAAIKAKKLLRDGNFDIVFASHIYRVHNSTISISFAPYRKYFAKFLVDADMQLKR